MDLINKEKLMSTTPIKFSIKLKNGDVLYGLNWKCDNALANVIIMPGMEEHSYRYDELLSLTGVYYIIFAAMRLRCG